MCQRFLPTQSCKSASCQAEFEVLIRADHPRWHPQSKKFRGLGPKHGETHDVTAKVQKLSLQNSDIDDIVVWVDFNPASLIKMKAQ